MGGALLAGAAIGFMPWNYPSAKVFLGDVGSYGLGMLIAILAVWAAAGGVSAWQAIAPLALYIADTSWTLAKRILRGSSWRVAHREHTYQLLLGGRLTHAGVTIMVGLATALLCAIAWVLPELIAIPISLTILAAYLVSPRILCR